MKTVTIGFNNGWSNKEYSGVKTIEYGTDCLKDFLVLKGSIESFSIRTSLVNFVVVKKS